MEIRKRFSGYAYDQTSLRDFLVKEVGDKADLSRSNLYGADLAGANLVGGNLYGADFNGADLHGANLSKADLSRSELSSANLSGSDLSGSDLHGSNLSNADLFGANLRGANLTRANLAGVNFSRANLSAVYGLPRGAVVANIHLVVFGAASKPNALDMSDRHASRAGLVVTLAGPSGSLLAELLGTSTAASIIYYASDPSLERVPDWFASNEEALADMKRLAEVSPRLTSAQ